MLIHQSKQSMEAVASAIWYPIWDAGLKLGHAVRTFDDHLSLAKDDLDTATALLTARPDLGRREAGRAGGRRRAEELDEAKKRWRTDLARRGTSVRRVPAPSPTSSNPTSRTDTAASATHTRCGGASAAASR
ncbi:MAG: hypothetical protein R2697_18260 [Ilumatobacteraceae bacterium]